FFEISASDIECRKAHNKLTASASNHVLKSCIEAVSNPLHFAETLKNFFQFILVKSLQHGWACQGQSISHTGSFDILYTNTQCGLISAVGTSINPGWSKRNTDSH